MSSARHLRPFPTGHRVQMTEDWKDRVVAELKARGQTQEWLAAQVGAAGRGTVSKMLKRRPDGKPTQTNSALVPRICEVLGLPLPLVATPDAKTARVVELLSASSEELKDSILSVLEAAVKKR